MLTKVLDVLYAQCKKFRYVRVCVCELDEVVVSLSKKERLVTGASSMEMLRKGTEVMRR